MGSGEPSGRESVNHRGVQMTRLLCHGERQTRFMREIVFGWRRDIRFSLITTDPQTLPKARTWYVMTNLEGKIPFTGGNTSGLRTWIEYGGRPCQTGTGLGGLSRD